MKKRAAAGAYELYFSMQHSAHDEEKLINIQLQIQLQTMF